MARENGAVVLDAALALDHAGKQVTINAQHRRHTAQQGNDDVHRHADIGAGKGFHAVGSHRVDQGRHHAEHHGAQHTADGTLHGLFGADHRAQLMLAEGTARKVGAGVAAPGKAEDEQDEEHGIVAELLHRQQFLEPDEGVEAEDHDARKHEQTAGLLVADGAVPHHQIDGVKGDQHKGHRHDQTAHDHVVGGHHQQGIRHQCRVHQPVLFGKAQRIVDLVDGNERDGCNDQIEDQRVEGEHDANEDDDAHNGCDNACFHRLALLCSAGRHSPLAGAAQPGERSGIPVPAPCTGYFGCSCCLTARQNGGCGD